MAGESNGTRSGSHFADSGQPRRTPRFKTTDQSGMSGTAAIRAAASRSDVDSSRIPSPEWDDSTSPRMVSADVARALDTLAPGQGARLTTRENAAQGASAARSALEGTGAVRIPRSSRPHVEARSKGGSRPIAIIVAIVAVLVAAAIFFIPKFLNPSNEPEPPSTLVTEANVGIGEGVEFGGYTYSIRETDVGTFVFTRLAAGNSDPYVLFELVGRPTSLHLGQGTFLIPENTAEGWDVVAYTMGDGSEAIYVVDANGEKISGPGAIESAVIEGSNLVLTDSEGTVHTIPLA